MKKSVFPFLTGMALLLAFAFVGQAANVPYFPYDTIEDYYKTPPEQPASQQPASQQPSVPPAVEKPRAGQPLAVGAAPEFLFPGKLGFGVAVGVPYDMMYISKTYYYWQEGVWYRSSSYRGHWTELGESQLPPELHNHTLSKIREIRNREFRDFWKDKEHYQGKRFRPGGEFKGEVKEK
jgi:hypothetical protein